MPPRLAKSFPKVGSKEMRAGGREGLVLSERRNRAGADVVTISGTSIAPASWILTLRLAGKRSGGTRN